MVLKEVHAEVSSHHIIKQLGICLPSTDRKNAVSKEVYFEHMQQLLGMILRFDRYLAF
jgi:hypothetical protein